MDRLPNFIIVGAAKSGTTSLCNYLSMHPFVEIVSERLEFFGEYCNPSIGKIDKNKYLNMFKSLPKHIIAGEKSVSYLYSDRAATEIYDLNPQMKIIMVLRDPVERAYSDYWQRRRTGVEGLSFEDALVAEKKRIASGARFELHYVNYGFYYSHIAKYINIFGRKNVCVIRFEELRDDPETVCRQCFNFLGVDDSFKQQQYDIYNKGSEGKNSKLIRILFLLAGNKKSVNIVRCIFPNTIRKKVTHWMLVVNNTKKYPPMNKSTEKTLRRIYSEDISRLENLLDWDLSRWKR